MSNGAVHEDAENIEFECGAWPFVARSQRERSSDHIGTRARSIAATSISIFGARTHCWPSDTCCRTDDAGNVQNSPRRTCTIACLFGQQRFDAERDRHPLHREVSDRDAPASLIWRGGLQEPPKFAWSSLSIGCFPRSCSKFMACWSRITFAQ
jgi:hypothetical protein